MAIEIKQIQYFDDHYYKIEIPYLTPEGEEITETKYFPSYTTKLSVINKPQLGIWRGDVGNREANLKMFEASMRGKRIHKAWETYTKGGVLVYQPYEFDNYSEEEIAEIKEKSLQNYFICQYQDEWVDILKLRAWVDVVKPDIHYSETIVYSLAYEEAGTVDNVFYIKEGEYLINGKKPLKLEEGLYIADLKTGKGVYDEAFLQVSGYGQAFEEMGLGTIVGALIIHTTAKTKTKTGIVGLSTILRTKEQMTQDFQDYRHVSELWKRKNPNISPKQLEMPTLIRMEKHEKNIQGES